MKLELKHLAPYLPYKLKCLYTHTNKIGTISNIYTIGEGYNDDDLKLSIDYSEGEHIWMFKPILRPLSEFEYDHIVQIKEHLGIGQWCDYYDTYFDAWFDDIANIDKLVLQCPYEIMQFFLKCHFDIFNLIPQGLAISINDINK
jgi:hypothetical protein